MKKIITHLSIVLSMVLITLIIINFFNPAMGFLKGDTFHVLLIIYVLLNLTAGIIKLIEYK